MTKRLHACMRADRCPSPSQVHLPRTPSHAQDKGKSGAVQDGRRLHDHSFRWQARRRSCAADGRDYPDVCLRSNRRKTKNMCLFKELPCSGNAPRCRIRSGAARLSGAFIRSVPDPVRQGEQAREMPPGRFRMPPPAETIVPKLTLKKVPYAFWIISSRRSMIREFTPSRIAECPPRPLTSSSC